MSAEDSDRPKIHVDDDWKAEAAREKQRLAEETRDVGRGRALPEPTFAEIINLITMQAIIGLGGLQGPGGQTIPPDLEVARHHIDLLAVLQDKTRGNLTPEEDRLLSATIHELRMRFVEAVTAAQQGGKGGPAAGGGPDIVTG